MSVGQPVTLKAFVAHRNGVALAPVLLRNPGKLPVVTMWNNRVRSWRAA